MAYTKTTWVNDTTPVNATNMNKIESGIKDLDDSLNSLKGSIEQTLTDSTTNIPSSGAVKTYIDDRLTYSTEEKVIGTYKDKPLYRKCLELGQIGSSSVTNTYELSGDYEKITICNARIEIDGGANLTLPMVSSEGLFAYCNASCTGDGTATITLYRNAAASWNEFNLNVDIEYTKTTD